MDKHAVVHHLSAVLLTFCIDPFVLALISIMLCLICFEMNRSFKALPATVHQSLSLSLFCAGCYQARWRGMQTSFPQAAVTA